MKSSCTEYKICLVCHFGFYIGLCIEIDHVPTRSKRLFSFGARMRWFIQELVYTMQDYFGFPLAKSEQSHLNCGHLKIRGEALTFGSLDSSGVHLINSAQSNLPHINDAFCWNFSLFPCFRENVVSFCAIGTASSDNGRGYGRG